MNKLVNIKIYEVKYNYILSCIKSIPVVDSFLILDSKRDLKDVFEELFDGIKYEYDSNEFPKSFRMVIENEIIDIKEESIIPYHTYPMYNEYKVHDYDEIETVASFYYNDKGRH